ncbi:MAG: hypothetical protein AVDCRST_MAG14-1349, partial [uncultured Rubrobacteraceae bacterium]
CLMYAGSGPTTPPRRGRSTASTKPPAWRQSSSTLEERGYRSTMPKSCGSWSQGCSH